MKTLTMLGALVALSWTAAASAQTGAPNQAAGDAERARGKVAMCQGCHGIEGWRTAFPEIYSVPRITGQHAVYLANALRAYRNGERKHPSMNAIAAQLSDEDIADLAAYYAQSPVNTAGK